jgi:hypothetical protein
VKHANNTMITDEALQELRRSVLHGKFMTSDEEYRHWNIPSTKMLIFVSSTFEDTMNERNELLNKTLPRLREKYISQGISIVLIDMRYGVKDESTKRHRTWLECARELVTCFNESAGLAFISLQAER